MKTNTCNNNEPTATTATRSPDRRKRIARLAASAVLAVTCLWMTGCAQVMAIQQPKPFKPTSLNQGTKRTDIVAELGQPTTSEERGATLTDVYRYVDGGAKNNGASKTFRVLAYTAGDVFTCWLDQVLWIPIEKFGFAGTDHIVTVDYSRDAEQRWCAKEITDREANGGAPKKEAR
jgi:hypothetical protein